MNVKKPILYYGESPHVMFCQRYCDIISGSECNFCSEPIKLSLKFFSNLLTFEQSMWTDEGIFSLQRCIHG